VVGGIAPAKGDLAIGKGEQTVSSYRPLIVPRFCLSAIGYCRSL
jgi:hypothetical protein